VVGDQAINQEIMDVAYKWARLQLLRRDQESGKVDTTASAKRFKL
jgi:hypothetical protein